MMMPNREDQKGRETLQPRNQTRMKHQEFGLSSQSSRTMPGFGRFRKFFRSRVTGNKNIMIAHVIVEQNERTDLIATAENKAQTSATKSESLGGTELAFQNTENCKERKQRQLLGRSSKCCVDERIRRSRWNNKTTILLMWRG